jgi:zinc protease
MIVESNHAVPLVQIAIAARGGSSTDPHKREGLSNLAAELARRGAGARTREQIDAALDELGATLEVETDADTVRFEGQVLARHLDAFLAILGDILIRPRFTAPEMARTKREVLAQIEESRTDDQQLCARFFTRNLYGDHPYGHSPDGTRAGVAAITRDEAAAHFKQQFAGRNLIIAAIGDVEVGDFAARVGRAFKGLPEGPSPRPAALRVPVPVSGWRIQLVDKPDRQQTQLMLGHATVPATDPDLVALEVGMAAFGGHGMNSTLMDEVRTKRGLAYGAYMNVTRRRGAGASAAWVFSGNDKAVETLKLVLKLYLKFCEKGLDPARVGFFKAYLAGSYASEIDIPEHRLDARITAEVVGLPPDFVDTYPDRVRKVTAAEVNAAITRHAQARDLAITMVATAGVTKKLLIEAKIAESAIDVVGFESDP